MATIRTANPATGSLGPYVFAFAAGAIALSDLAATRKADDERKADAKLRGEITDKLLDRLASLYRAPRARRRPLP